MYDSNGLFVDLVALGGGYDANGAFIPIGPELQYTTNGLELVSDTTYKVTLDWADNLEADLAGYNVYRATVSGGPYTKINGALVTSSTYIDTPVDKTTIYHYTVTAVDTTGNESVASTEASVTTPAPPLTYELLGAVGI